MTGGLRVAGAAMTNYACRHDVISNNLANVSTRGFAREDTFLERVVAATAEPFRPPELSTRVDFTPGAPILTGNPLDLSLEGSGFFSVVTDSGERFTRNADLRVDPQGILRTGDGHPVLGENGLLFVGDGRVLVEKDGSIFVDDSLLDRLKLTTFARGSDIAREPGGLYTPRPGAKPDPGMPRPFVQTGQIEGSAVEPVVELVRMIEAVRAYEAAAAAVRATDRTVERAVNDIARI